MAVKEIKLRKDKLAVMIKLKEFYLPSLVSLDVSIS